MIDTVLWWTGLLFWVSAIAYVGPMVPALVVIVFNASIYHTRLWLDNRFYDDVDDVREARDNGRWHYYLTHSLLRVEKSVESIADAYIGVIECLPWYRWL